MSRCSRTARLRSVRCCQRLLTNHFSELGRQTPIDDVKYGHFVDFVTDPSFLCHFGEYSRWQIQVNRVYYFIGQIVIGVSVDQGFRQLLSVCFASTIVLYLDVKVLTSLRAKELTAAIVRTNVGSIDFSSGPSKVLLSPVLGIWRRRALMRGLLELVGLAVHATQRFLLLCALLYPGLSFLGLKQQLLLMLLLAKPVKELVRLGHDLGNKCVLVVVFDVENLSAHFVVLLRCLVHITHQVFVLDVNSPELFVVIHSSIILWWLLRAHHLVHVNSANLVW